MIPFTKLHGLGNDYLHVDLETCPVADPPALARCMSDRHLGVGADGLILVSRPRPGVAADARMRIFNADGSEAEMCGNGVRCVCKFLVDRGQCTSKPMHVETGAGVLALDYDTDADGRVTTVTVDMGSPRLLAGDIPIRLDGMSPEEIVIDVDHALAGLDDWPEAAGLQVGWSAVSMGNPHLVLFCKEPGAVPLEDLGPQLETARAFPTRINVHVVRVDRRDHLTMRTWERGSGITQACGTGAAAVCVAAAVSGRADDAVTITLPGGDLQLAYERDEDRVMMTGPATEVFSGHWADA